MNEHMQKSLEKYLSGCYVNPVELRAAIRALIKKAETLEQAIRLIIHRVE